MRSEAEYEMAASGSRKCGKSLHGGLKVFICPPEESGWIEEIVERNLMYVELGSSPKRPRTLLSTMHLPQLHDRDRNEMLTHPMTLRYKTNESCQFSSICLRSCKENSDQDRNLDRTNYFCYCLDG